MAVKDLLVREPQTPAPVADFGPFAVNLGP